MPQKIVPFLWFDGKAEEAVSFYTETFGKDCQLVNVSRFGDGMPFPKGTVMVATFDLFGQRFSALNGGPQYKFTPAVSFLVNCETQEEVDRLWDKLLSGGGKPSMCGWLEDRYGVSWQIVPTILERLLTDPDSEKASRVMNAMLQMIKIDIPTLKRAHEGA